MSTLTAEQVRVQMGEIDNAREALRTREREVMNACSHKNADGSKATSPTMGGFAMCGACGQEVD